jgi:Flp pilus assembly protein TadG
MEISKDVKRIYRQESGTTMLETAIVLPFLLLILFAIIESGILFGRYLTVTNAAREGAREAIVFQTDCDPALVTADVIASVDNYTASAGITTATTTVVGACDGSGTPSTVSVTYAYDNGVLSTFAPSTPSIINIVGTSTMRNE